MPVFNSAYELRFYPTPDKEYIIDYFYYAQTAIDEEGNSLFGDDSDQEHPWAAYAPTLLIALAAANYAATQMQNQQLARNLLAPVAQMRQQLWHQSVAIEMQNLVLNLGGEETCL